MAFDWSSVEGFSEDMSAEERVALLDNYEAPKPDMSGFVEKKQFDKVSSDLAAAKKQLRARMTADEQAEEERNTAISDMKAELEKLRREKTISSHKASFLAQGYPDELAEEAAVAMTDGDTDVVFTAMQKQRAAAERELRAQLLKETPHGRADEDAEQTERQRVTDALRKYMNGVY